MYELLLRSVRNWLTMSTFLNMAEQAMGSEYALMFINMSNCARILNLPKCTRMWGNIPQYA